MRWEERKDEILEFRASPYSGCGKPLSRKASKEKT
jgi:hypothetical protein